MRKTQRRITFTTFMDFVMANGASKLARIRAAIAMYNAEAYRPSDYYYLDLKHAITRCFEGQGVAALDACIAGLDDQRKHENYIAITVGLRKWIGRRQFEVFAVPARDWISGDLAVSVRPDLGLVHKGERLVVKFYLKDEPLTQHRINPPLHLLDASHGTLGTVAIVDARRGKLFKITRPVRDVDAFLAAEAQSFVSLWKSLAA